jgi:hypothetical protein
VWIDEERFNRLSLGIVQMPLPDRAAILASMALHDPEDAPESNATSDKLKEVHKRALRRFDSVAMPQAEIRAHALLCRRFISIPGAMWEGPWGDQFENSIKVEIDKLSKGVDKIVQDYRANRIVPDFRPPAAIQRSGHGRHAGRLHRADSYHFKAQQARDNAFEEAAAEDLGHIASPTTMPTRPTRKMTSSGSIRGC